MMKLGFRRAIIGPDNELSSRLAVVFAQSIGARCYVENEDVVGAVATGDAPAISEWVINNLRV